MLSNESFLQSIDKSTQRVVKEFFDRFGNLYINLKDEDKVYREIYDFIREYGNREQAILEIGCGGGVLLKHLRMFNAYDLYGIDVSKSTLCAKGEKINIAFASADALPFKRNSFDFIIASRLLHHLVGKTREISKDIAYNVIKTGLRALKKQGHLLVLEEPCVGGKWASLAIFYFTRLFSQLNLQWQYFNIKRNVLVSFFTPCEIEEIVKKLNYEGYDVEIVNFSILQRNLSECHFFHKIALRLVKSSKIFLSVKKL